MQRSEFVALWNELAQPGGPVVEDMSMSTGKPLQTVYTPPSGWAVGVPFTGTHGDLWITLTRGPLLRSAGTAGGDPEPGTCAGEVIRLNPANGRASVVMTSPDNVAIADAVPSPGGHRIAYLAGGCATSYFDMHLVVRSLVTGSQQAHLASLTPCHGLSPPSWSAHGRRILLTVSPSTLPAGSPAVASETCQAPAAGELDVLTSSGPGTQTRPPSTLTSRGPGTMTEAPGGCSYAGAVFDAGGIAAVRVCGLQADDYMGAGYLVQLSRSTSELSVDALEPFDGASLMTNESGQVLVDEYEPPTYSGTLGHQVQTGPFDWVWTFDGKTLHLVARYVAHATAITGATWW